MVNVYKLPRNANRDTQIQLADLLMGQMESIGTKEPYQQALKTIELALHPDSQAHIFVAEKDEAMVGAAFLNVGLSLDKGGYYIWLNDLYVHKEHRNQGIAKKILLKIIYWAETKEIKGIELETGINNEATKALYNSLGFYDIISKRYGFRF
ncbi:GNAT family N-acetyltransferase [Halalkalibacterium halodurans]|uniref:GNAT family N-acetyltransferase n=1 Tax=Halalkalibacterium halodurans TaxID=86665 RepID=UPI002AA9BA9C|nr:GNAT family N-acetyltransferase [Halalkalibacterium halodurans]MDY7223459.1 GNAT family N-acetyltransferase [Halalkalibacterium halodurans]MDY7242680.1 GNAT family N-acetyltransferase [Halalkalibacterium halodurans]MED4081613.1 GNAT family N-acetyltransferase [Halalkalibacterium halodurans]MED4084975.1 GNAT family N-acetyltransferase [Halalkalibacterium halodurans]MED4104138.1 GNAT family N-acetyltransferase [Halalkalibacterium halodurans]